MSKKWSVISEKGEITPYLVNLRIVHWDGNMSNSFFFYFHFEPLIIFSYFTLICRHNIVDLNFLCLLTHALTTGNVRNTVEILILMPCVFYTRYSILDIPTILYLCNVQSMGSV